MKRLLSICLLIGILNINVVYGSGGENPSNNQHGPFEAFYLKHGYKSVEDAVKECENNLHRELQLPAKLPPVKFTHRFGRFTNMYGKKIDGLEVHYLNEKDLTIHYMITVKPIEHKMNFHSKNGVSGTYKLKDEREAVYLTITRHGGDKGVNVLVFEKNGWQYMLSIDKRMEEKVPTKVLIEIAESVENTSGKN
ncbi:hypothetical protein [Aneurinibacillus tyrosinisolvens]|uniref:hypothetical protein n=1 Tax=Aneurinibacillus tyrosinisolvens TaxID=1443435 RepID=UPI00069C9919|nr:hypothetical protein [Aneurinibacillus tyrosinisolvens]